MGATMKLLCFVLMLAQGSLAFADDPEHSASQTKTEVLHAGKDFIILFPEGSDFDYKCEAVVDTEVPDEKGGTKPGEPVTVVMRTPLEIFNVVRVAGWWALLEYPADPVDVLEWNAQRKALAQLTPENIASLKGSLEGRGRIRKRRAAAAKSVKTTTAWINLSQAIAITELPSELPERDISEYSAALSTIWDSPEVKKRMASPPEKSECKGSN